MLADVGTAVDIESLDLWTALGHARLGAINLLSANSLVHNNLSLELLGEEMILTEILP